MWILGSVIWIVLYSWCRLVATLARVMVGCGKGRPVKIIKDNSVEAVVFGNTDIPHPCNHTVSQWSLAGSSSMYVYIYIYKIRNWRDHRRTGTHGNCTEIFRQARPSFSIGRDSYFGTFLSTWSIYKLCNTYISQFEISILSWFHEMTHYYFAFYRKINWMYALKLLKMFLV